MIKMIKMIKMKIIILIIINKLTDANLSDMFGHN